MTQKASAVQNLCKVKRTEVRSFLLQNNRILYMYIYQRLALYIQQKSIRFCIEPDIAAPNCRDDNGAGCSYHSIIRLRTHCHATFPATVAATVGGKCFWLVLANGALRVAKCIVPFTYTWSTQKHISTLYMYSVHTVYICIVHDIYTCIYVTPV